MNGCKALDCIFINRELFLCELPFVEHDNNGVCLSYKRDKEQLKTMLHKIASLFSKKGYDPETEQMLSMAPSITLQAKRLERRKKENASDKV